MYVVSGQHATTKHLTDSNNMKRGMNSFEVIVLTLINIYMQQTRLHTYKHLDCNFSISLFSLCTFLLFTFLLCGKRVLCPDMIAAAYATCNLQSAAFECVIACALLLPGRKAYLTDIRSLHESHIGLAYF